MWSPRENEGSDGIVSLVKETAEGLSRLISDHMKLARVELTADARAYGRHVGLLAIGAVVLLVGYGFAWLAAALALARVIGAPLAFLAVAVPHLIAGAIVLKMVADRLKAVKMLDDTKSEVSRSVATLTAQVSGGARATSGARVPSGP